MSLKHDSPRSSQLSVPTPVPDKARRRSSVGIGETITTYHILANSKDDASSLEIQQKGRTALLAKTTKPTIGSPTLQITTPKVDGESTVATAKLHANSGKCKIMLGDPTKTEVKPDWTQVQHTSNLDRVFIFEHDSKQYIWRRRINIDPKFIHQTDLELVTAEDSDTILATYLPNRKAVSRNQIARLDFLVDMPSELEVLCLTSVLGGRQSSRMEDAVWGITSRFRRKEKSELALHPAGAGRMGVLALSLGGGGGAC
ncbi:hypothetical protein CKM354_000191300 [Cercospora kikuchii]|uniref:Uncharacterized protein n=1 Tax=Cercospora kikuchii TaxID=84275 RepID=A0A9P3CBH5_9PEZI|nr:uncharacterized protein CKM354_000191300 [Cercospora kikuchii]GIZ38496.1 hypothetical protein CKM354_000191300 [Cercospora kikuchii]